MNTNYGRRPIFQDVSLHNYLKGEQTTTPTNLFKRTIRPSQPFVSARLKSSKLPAEFAAKKLKNNKNINKKV